VGTLPGQAVRVTTAVHGPSQGQRGRGCRLGRAGRIWCHRLRGLRRLWRATGRAQRVGRTRLRRRTGQDRRHV